MRQIKSKYLFALIALLFSFEMGFGQFQYFGANLHGFFGVPGMNGGGISLSYLKQVSPAVGFGAELSFPRVQRLDSSLYNSALVWPEYEMGTVWTRRQSPSLILRYRLQPGNGFFVGVSAHAGIVTERFFVDRNYGVTYLFGTQVEVPAAYADYVLRSPFMKFHFETGFLANLGEKMFMTGQFSGGLQYTFTKVKTFGEIQVSGVDTPAFDPIQGLNGNVGILFGMGVKI